MEVRSLREEELEGADRILRLAFGTFLGLPDPTAPLFDERGARHRGLFTFGHSPRHLSLYQGYGFLPRFLTAIPSKAVSGPRNGWTAFSALGARRSPIPRRATPLLQG